jgi:four helix bundle protein
VLAVLAVLARAARAVRGSVRLRAVRSVPLRSLAPPCARGREVGVPDGTKGRFVMMLHIYSVAIDMVRQLRPLIEQIGTRDSNLADQLRRAASSVPLNLHEGAYSQGGHVRARFHNALGSAAEVKACLDVAEAMGYLEVDPGLRNTVDRIVATVHRLTRR